MGDALRLRATDGSGGWFLGGALLRGSLADAVHDGELALVFVLKASDLLGAESSDLGDLLDGVATLEHLLGVLADTGLFSFLDSFFDSFLDSFLDSFFDSFLDSLLDSFFEDVV